MKLYVHAKAEAARVFVKPGILDELENVAESYETSGFRFRNTAGAGPDGIDI